MRDSVFMLNDYGESCYRVSETFRDEVNTDKTDSSDQNYFVRHHFKIRLRRLNTHSEVVKVVKGSRDCKESPIL